MRKSITVVLTVILFTVISFTGKAQSPNASSNSNQHQGSGVVISLNSNSGLIMDDITGEVFEFHNAGIEILEINQSYIYIVQVTANGKVIIRDIHKKRVPGNTAGTAIN